MKKKNDSSILGGTIFTLFFIFSIGYLLFRINAGGIDIKNADFNDTSQIVSLVIFLSIMIFFLIFSFLSAKKILNMNSNLFSPKSYKKNTILILLSLVVILIDVWIFTSSLLYGIIFAFISNIYSFIAIVSGREKLLDYDGDEE